MRLLGPIARHRRGLLGAITLAVAAGVVVVLVLVAGSPSPTPASGAAKTAAGAATVKRRNLVQTDTEAGTLSYANPQTVYDRLSGTITWLPSVGQVIRAGGTLFRVNGTPVILMDGSAAAYRTLSSADSDGEDILQLNRNLVALGFNANGIVVDDQWQEATTLGVELLQESLGETATGSLSLGRVVFLPGPQLVSTVEGTVGDTDNGGSSATPAALTTDPPAPELVSLTTSDTTTTTTTTTSTTPTTTPTTTTTAPTTHHKPKKGAGQTPSLQALLALLKAESAQLKAEAEQLKAEQHQNGGSPSGSGSGSGNGGKGGGGKGGGGNSGNKGNKGNSGNSGNSPSSGSNGSTGVAVLQTNSNHLVVTVDLDASLQSEAKVGEKVSVQLPAGTTVSGKVTAVSSVAQSSSSGNNGSGTGSGSGGGNGGGGGGGGSGGGSGSGSSSTIPVTITLSGHHKGAGLDEAAVSVSFAQARAKNVLSVPVTALLAVSGGNYAVQEAAAPHTLIPVTVGLFAAGYVQISGPGIHTGLQVTDSQG
jgi:hypothetical protein